MSEHKIYRLLDAASNRACEAVRVVEDVVRFVFNDQFLTKEWKELRHNLASALQALPAEMRFAFRHTETDVGASITLASEIKRSSTADLLAANVARLQQALRSLEESLKLLDVKLSQKIEALRYRSYVLASATQTIEESIQRLQDVRLCVLIDGGASEQDYSQLIDLLLSADVGAIQLRDKEMIDAELVLRARLLVEKTRGRKTLSIINDRPDIVVLTGADGVHVGQSDLSVKDARQILGPGGLIGVSTHNAGQLSKAILDGANYAGIGPIFESETKIFASYGGLPLIEQIANQTALPVFAIGGINLKNADAVIQAGIRRVAVASAITRAADPRSVVVALNERLCSATEEAMQSKSPAERFSL
ncbi:MAG: thiamine phosphate synthase [Pirellulales bacterium]|nr:thiamine phosphate synthase [Pirellulales bacterium]